MYRKYNKLKELLREICNTDKYIPQVYTHQTSPSSSPELTYSIPIYETYECEDKREIVFKEIYKRPPNKEDDILLPYMNNNKIIVEIIILSYLFSSTLVLEFIKYIFN